MEKFNRKTKSNNRCIKTKKKKKNRPKNDVQKKSIN